MATVEELQAQLDLANAELAQLREDIGVAEAAQQAAEATATNLQLSWNQMQMQRNQAGTDRSNAEAATAVMQAARDLKQRIVDRWATFADAVDTIQNGGGTNAQKLTQLRAALTTCRADIATIIAGG